MRTATSGTVTVYARYIGRVGALAAALGVGVLVAGSPGVAWASPEGTSATDDSDASSSTARNTTTTGSVSTGTTGTGATETATESSVSSPPSSTVSASTNTGSQPATSTGTQTTTTKTGDAATTTRLDGQGTPPVLINAHSASSSNSTSGGASAAVSAPATAVAGMVSGRTGARKPASVDSGVTTRVAHAIGVAAAPEPALSVSTVTSSLTSLPPQLSSPVAGSLATTQRSVVTSQAQPTALDSAVLPHDPLTAVVAGVLSALGLSPSAGQASGGAPVQTPVMFTVLAWVRREFQYTLLNESPTVNPVQIAEDAQGVVTGDLQADGPVGATLTYNVTTQATQGTAQVNPDGIFTYTPNPDFAHAGGQDTFTVVVDDGSAYRLNGPLGLVQSLIHSFAQAVGISGPDTTTRVVTVNVSLVNKPPTITGYTKTIPDDNGSVTGLVRATDLDNDELTFSGPTSTTGGGAVDVHSDGSFSYSPTADMRHSASADGASGDATADDFTVTVSDGHGGTDTKSVIVSVSPSNDKPTGGAVTGLQTGADGVVTGAVTGVTDPNNDELTFSGPTTSTGGNAVEVKSDGTFTYTPTSDARFVAGVTTGDDTDTFMVTADDGHGGTVTTPVTVTITPADLASNPAAALAAAESVITASTDAITTNTAAMTQAVQTLSPTLDAAATRHVIADAQLVTNAGITPASLSAMQKDIAPEMPAISQDQLETLLTSLSANIKAINDNQDALAGAIKVREDATARLAQQAASDGKPVFGRVEYTVNPDGTADGTLTFIDDQPLVISGGVITNPKTGFGSIGLGAASGLPGLWPPNTFPFRYTPGPLLGGSTPASVTFLVFATDPDNNTVAVNVTLDDLNATPPTSLNAAANALADANAGLAQATADRQAALQANGDVTGAEAQMKAILAEIDAAQAATNNIING